MKGFDGTLKGLNGRLSKDSGGSAQGAVRYDEQQTLTNVQKRQAKLNIGADEVDNLESFSRDRPLAANQGRVLNERINYIAGIGKFLSLWNCATGLAESNPPTLPYEYTNGAYFRISVVPDEGEDILMPDGSTYTGEPSSAVYDGELTLETGDLFIYDAASDTWLSQKNQIGGKVQDVTVNNVSRLVGGVARFSGEVWTATLTDGTEVTKKIVMYD